MSEKTEHKLPRVAIYVGGPLDGQTVGRQTNRFPRFKRDDGGRMGTKVQERNWHQQFDEFRWPKAGYTLRILPDRNLANSWVARYVHHTIYWDFAELEDRYWSTAQEFWNRVRFYRAKYPEVDPRRIDYDPGVVADALDLFEQMDLDIPEEREGAEDLAQEFGIDPKRLEKVAVS